MLSMTVPALASPNQVDAEAKAQQMVDLTMVGTPEVGPPTDPSSQQNPQNPDQPTSTGESGSSPSTLQACTEKCEIDWDRERRDNRKYYDDQVYNAQVNAFALFAGCVGIPVTAGGIIKTGGKLLISTTVGGWLTIATTGACAAFALYNVYNRLSYLHQTYIRDQNLANRQYHACLVGCGAKLP